MRTVGTGLCVCILQRSVGLGAAGPGASELAPTQYYCPSASGAGEECREVRRAQDWRGAWGGDLFAGRLAMGACGICVAGSCFAAPGAQLCWCLRIQTGQAHLAMHTPRPLPQHRSALSGPLSLPALPPSIPPPCGSIPMGTSVLRAALKFPNATAKSPRASKGRSPMHRHPRRPRS